MVRAFILGLLLAFMTPSPSSGADAPSFIHFESGPVRPLALSADRKWLYAVNTPDNHLEIFRVRHGKGAGGRRSCTRPPYP